MFSSFSYNYQGGLLYEEAFTNFISWAGLLYDSFGNITATGRSADEVYRAYKTDDL